MIQVGFRTPYYKGCGTRPNRRPGRARSRRHLSSSFRSVHHFMTSGVPASFTPSFPMRSVTTILPSLERVFISVGILFSPSAFPVASIYALRALSASTPTGMPL